LLSHHDVRAPYVTEHCTWVTGHPHELSAAAHVHPVTNTTDVGICRGRSGQGVKIDFEHKDVVKWIYRFE
jgi:IMP cyclohydrolase